CARTEHCDARPSRDTPCHGSRLLSQGAVRRVFQARLVRRSLRADHRQGTSRRRDRFGLSGEDQRRSAPVTARLLLCVRCCARRRAEPVPPPAPPAPEVTWPANHAGALEVRDFAADAPPVEPREVLIVPELVPYL